MLESVLSAPNCNPISCPRVNLFLICTGNAVQLKWMRADFRAIPWNSVSLEGSDIAMYSIQPRGLQPLDR